jgi:transposase
VSKKYQVRLTVAQRQELTEFVTRGKAAARALTYARILLKADEAEGGPAWSNAALMEAFDVSEPLIIRVRRRFAESGLAAALQRKEQAKRKEPRLDGAQQARLLALACSPAPEGRDRWSLRLLAEQVVELGIVEAVSHETVRQVLKRGRSSPT